MCKKLETKHILEQVKSGEMSIEEAERFFKQKPYEELGYAKLDFHREVRQGFGEVVFCSGKPDEYLISIFRRIFEENGEVLGTRASKHQYEILKESFIKLS